MYKKLLIIGGIILCSCNNDVERIHPTVGPISESIYASGIVKTENQYQAFATVNGIIENVYVKEGDSVKIGTPILSIANEAQRLNKENAELAAAFADLSANQGKLNEAKLMIDLSRNKMKNDSLLYHRQRVLWEQQIGSRVELEQRELAFQNSKSTYHSSIVRYEDLKRQLEFAASQSKKNLLISSSLESDYILRSEIDGIVYGLDKEKGEIVTIQSPLAVIGAANKFILEMQVDEYDIFKVKVGLPVIVTLDSYKGQVFYAKITKINPLMNERNKTFLVEAKFLKLPERLYPNITFEANIIVQTKEKAIIIPRNYLTNDSLVLKSNGDKVIVKTGLRDYKKIEIISGITAADELIKPKE